MMQAENRFTCDRCKINISVALQNTPRRDAAPDGWATIRCNEDNPALHLCPLCATIFHLMMDGA